ncbi:hypothetical protein T440DRAFT_471075 [Plenodomus tracheiphilus IPT5]|uniref:Fungal N-terminal domain-containing protein n=1 Tax=Plenodomus tracheiphilus IPT5 TaxID=1408161 RepID=A0A6A7AWB8_9PLEO|nr:hypothetical protein T440DRAFT_471075 [Plenodomus tracheiphilus IPT5]
MAEVVGAGAAGVQLFETAIDIFKHIKTSYKRSKELTSILDKHGLELERIRDLSDSVRNEKALEGAKFSEPLARIKELEHKICKWLAKVDPGDKTSLRKFADQLVRGQDDRKKLDNIMQDLDRAKSDLSMIMAMHQAKVSYKISEAVIPRNNHAFALNQKSVKHRSAVRGTKTIVPSPARSNDHFSDSGISSDSSSETSTQEETRSISGSISDLLPGPLVRSIKRNKAIRGATMINASLGKVDRGAHIQVLEIEDNECEDDAEMINYPNDEEGMEILQKRQVARAAHAREQRRIMMEEQREQLLWEKKNGFR